MRNKYYVLALALVLALCATGWAAPTPGAPLPAPAASGEPGAATDGGSGGSIVDALIIDTAGIYESMNMSYDSGYKPEIKDDVIHIILPLIINKSSGAAGVVGNRIKVVPSLGSATDTPFIFEGVHMQAFSLDGQLTGANSGSEPKTYFLVKLPVKLKAERAGGDYPISLAVDYTVEGEEDTQTQQVTFTVPVTAKGTGSIATPTDGNGDGGGETAPPVPEGNGGGGDSFTGSGGGGGGGTGSTGSARLMLEEYHLSSNPVVAGDEFDLSVKLKNTSTKAAINNLIITFSEDTAAIVPAGNTKSVFVKQIKANASESVGMRMKVRMDAEAKPVKVAIQIAGEDKDGTGITENLDVLVDIKQPTRIEFDEPSFFESVNAGNTEQLTMNIMNKGRATLYNVQMKLEGRGLSPEGSHLLGNMEPGTSKVGELTVFIGTLDMFESSGNGEQDGADSLEPDAGDETEPDMVDEPEESPDAGSDEPEQTAEPEGDDMAATDEPEQTDEPETDEPEELEGDGLNPYLGEKYGPTYGKIIVTYEDNYGEEFTEEIEISTTIEEPMISTGEIEEPEPEPEKATQWWVSLLIGLGVIAVICIAMLIMRKRRMDRITAEDDAD